MTPSHAESGSDAVDECARGRARLLSRPDTLPDWLRPLADEIATVGEDAVASRFRPPEGAGRASAVLVLFAAGASGPDVLLTERAAAMRRHAGQPAFPGGALEPDDDGPVAAAVREAAEETGLEPDSVEVFATLPDLWIERTGFRVTPVLGWWRRPSEVTTADLREVAAVARVPVRDLADPAHRVALRRPDGRVESAFRVSGMLVWGFTANLLDWLLRLGGWERPWQAVSRVEEMPY